MNEKWDCEKSQSHFSFIRFPFNHTASPPALRASAVALISSKATAVHFVTFCHFVRIRDKQPSHKSLIKKTRAR